MPFVTVHFKELISSSNLSPHPLVILHAGLARSCRIRCFKSERKPSPRGEDAHVRADEGWRKRVLPRHLSTVWDLPSPGERGILSGMMNEKWNQEGVTPRSLSFLLLSNSMVKRRKIETTTSKVATARMVGLICSRIPENICQGMVRWR